MVKIRSPGLKLQESIREMKRESCKALPDWIPGYFRCIFMVAGGQGGERVCENERLRRRFQYFEVKPVGRKENVMSFHRLEVENMLGDRERDSTQN